MSNCQLLSPGMVSTAFRDSPLPGDGVYFGFPENITAHLLVATIDASVAGIGIDPRDPPLAWEAWCGDTAGWVRVEIDSDTTGGFNQLGSVTMLLPAGMEVRTLGGGSLYWIRFRVVQPRAGQAGYTGSPGIRGRGLPLRWRLHVASHSAMIDGEILGRASGAPGETYAFARRPLLDRTQNERIEVLEGCRRRLGRMERGRTFQDSGPGSTLCHRRGVRHGDSSAR